MIQRIQSIYLLLASLVNGLLFFALPFATAEKTADGAFIDGDLDLYDNTTLLALVAALVAASFITIFLYGNRKLQMNLSFVGIALCLATAGLGAYFAFGSGVAASVAAGLFMPVVAIVFLFLAYKGIKSDDDLVKSSNRLR